MTLRFTAIRGALTRTTAKQKTDSLFQAICAYALKHGTSRTAAEALYAYVDARSGQKTGAKQYMSTARKIKERLGRAVLKECRLGHISQPRARAMLAEAASAEEKLLSRRRKLQAELSKLTIDLARMRRRHSRCGS